MSFIPSPLSTGHAGPSYEQHLGASCLALLLTGGILPFSADKTLTKVHFQARHLGWMTDDLLLSGTSQTGAERHLAIQAKRSFVLAAGNEECLKTFRAAWDDFSNRSLFQEGRDRIALITGEAPTNFSRGMRNVLDAARASLDEGDFAGRVSSYLSNEARKCYECLCGILRDHAGDAASDREVWRFLRVWDFAVLDFHTPSGVSEALIKSLLSASGDGTDPGTTWNVLFNLAVKDAGRARSFSWAELPEDLRTQHRIPSATMRDTLEQLRVVSEMIRHGVGNRLSNAATLPRGQVVADGLSLLDELDAVLVTGPAGIGKSVIASKLHDAISLDTLALAFRADSLATPHLATSAQQVGLNLRSLVRLFALHPRKLLWIESAERLFEKSRPEREAFMDLLRVVAREGGWKLIITCREYSAEKLRTAFLEPAGWRSGVITVPELSDEELSDAIAALPKLQLPLKDPVLRKVLRNPLHLDLAARMEWREEDCASMNRRAFREKAWRDIVCQEDEMGEGMPLERERAMIEIALRRAKALVPYVSSNGIPAAPIHALQRSSLLAQNPGDIGQFSPAHDVFEDWALFRWLRRLVEQAGGVNGEFFEALGDYPALRRAFRLWLLEMLEVDLAKAEQVILGMMRDSALPLHWQDEAFVAIFQCADASQVIKALEPALLAGDCSLLRRAIHLLRVACRRSPTGVPAEAKNPNLLLVPDGGGWDAMPPILLKATDSLLTSDIFWLLGFLEDWIKAARKFVKPIGAEEVAVLCDVLLSCTQHINHGHRKAYRKRVICILLGIPLAAEQRLRFMVETALSDDEGSREDRVILKLIWNHFSGSTICRDLPHLVLRVAERQLGLEPGSAWKIPSADTYLHSSNLNPVFGLRHRSDMDDFPASAWQGPFLNLLTHHPALGSDLVLRLANRCCEAYAAAGGTRIEEPVEVHMPLDTGEIRPQWANWRLWGLYRGASVGPYVLQSSLMALEDWLLQKGARGDADLRATVDRLLAESNNVAITAVIASVAIAYPYLLSESALPLLTVEGFFDADLSRSVHDQANSRSIIAEMWPDRDAEKAMLEMERSEAAKKHHRRQNLESLAVMLQMTSARPRVWKLIDRCHADLPPEDEQDDNDRIRRLRLHRMDVRNFVASGKTDEGNQIFQAGPATPDLEEFRNRDLPAHEDREERTWLYLWGTSVFQWREPEKFRPEEWREKLRVVRNLPLGSDGDLPRLLFKSGAPQIAGVCLRDHWDDLDEEELNWCVETLLGELELLPGLGAFAAGMTGTGEAINVAAYLAPQILVKSTDPAIRARAIGGLLGALLYEERPIVQAAANGIGAHLYAADQTSALWAVQMLIEWATETTAFRGAQRSLPWDGRKREADFDKTLRERLRNQTVPTALDEAALFSIDFLRHPGVMVLLPILGIFGRAHADSLAQRFYIHAGKVLVDAWRSDQVRHGSRGDDEDLDDTVDLRYMERSGVAELLVRFALDCPDAPSRELVGPLVDEALVYHDEAADFIKKLAYAEDCQSRGGRFWQIWQSFADAVLANAETFDFSQKHELIDALFLGIYWKPETCEWSPLSGEGRRLLALFRDLPPTPESLSAFSRIAARFQNELIPGALPALAEKLSILHEKISIWPTTMLSLETILQEQVYSGAPNVRQDAELRNAALAILNILVECGSSAAFKMRDDFVTPLRA